MHALSVAPDCNFETRTFRITHPFHPLRGREFLLVTFRQNWDEDRVYFYDEAERLRSIPRLWTSLRTPDLFVEVSDGRSAFRVCDLVELAELLAVIKGDRA